MSVTRWFFSVCLALLTASAFVSAYTYAWRARHERAVERTLAEVHGMLRIWAKTWPDEAVREQLLAVLHRP